MVTKLRVVEGDIFHEPADAMLVTVDTAGNWGGQMNESFKRPLQSCYEAELMAAGPLKNGDVVFASGQLNVAPAFEKIIFMVDEHREPEPLPLDQLVGAALRKADDADLTTVTVPLLRIDRKFRSEDPVMALLRAALIFRNLNLKKSLQEISIVVHQNPAAVKFLEYELARADESDKQNRRGYIAT